jgi:hypothetical protein
VIDNVIEGLADTTQSLEGLAYMFPNASREMEGTQLNIFDLGNSPTTKPPPIQQTTTSLTATTPTTNPTTGLGKTPVCTLHPALDTLPSASTTRNVTGGLTDTTEGAGVIRNETKGLMKVHRNI